MYSLRLFVGIVLMGGLALAAFPGELAAQAHLPSAKSSASSARSDWNRRVLRGSHRAGNQTVATEGTFQAVLNAPGGRLKPDNRVVAATHSAPSAMDDGVLLPERAADQIEMMPLEGEYFGEESCSSCGSAGNTCDSCGISCGSCTPGCWQGQTICHQLWNQCATRLSRKVTFFAGVQGFKGPVDQGANGNFGFHEGLNLGMPLGDPWGIGFQAGVQAVHSNFSGDQVSGARTDNRDQVFFTTGLFRRPACVGLQWGVVLDFLSDSYYASAELQQMRVELALANPNRHEIGFWGAFGSSDDELRFIRDGATVDSSVEPIDVYALFYRRHFSGGGQGRVWAGLSNRSDALLGAEITVPLGTSWALENNFTYVIPEEGSDTGAQQNESWSVVMQLVWYPGRHAECVNKTPFHPLLGVADNTWFLVNRK